MDPAGHSARSATASRPARCTVFSSAHLRQRPSRLGAPSSPRRAPRSLSRRGALRRDDLDQIHRCSRDGAPASLIRTAFHRRDALLGRFTDPAVLPLRSSSRRLSHEAALASAREASPHRRPKPPVRFFSPRRSSTSAARYGPRAHPRTIWSSLAMHERALRAFRPVSAERAGIEVPLCGLPRSNTPEHPRRFPVPMPDG